MKSLKWRHGRISEAVFSWLVRLVVLALTAPASWAQTGTAELRGIVQDTNQAVIPGAAVTITNLETNAIRKALTSEAGVYHFGALPLGPYALEIEAPGFKKWATRLELQVGQTAVVNAVLPVGQIQNVVEVLGAAPVITTESIEVADVKDYQRIRQLPLNGRAVSTLFNLTPGVEGGGNARVNGLKVGSLEITLDGVSLVDRFGGGIARVQPGLDTVQEFRIETVGSDARYSRPATVTLATRSGTNQFHGSLFETHRNNASGLLARRREETGGRTLAHLVRNEFGASAGGPLYLGKLYDGRDRSFWFFAYEGLRNRQSRFVSDIVPTEAMWNGDFSNIVDASGRRTAIYDPRSTDANGQRQPFPGNIIPADRIHSLAKLLRSLTPRPTNDNNPFLADNFQRFYPDKTDSDNLTFKGDHLLSNRDHLSARWTRSTRHAAVEGGVFGTPIDASAGFGTSRSDVTINNVSAHYTRIQSPRLLNELLVGAHRSFNSSGTLADFTDWPGRLGLPNPFRVTGWPTLSVGNFGWDADNRKDEALTGVVLEDHATWNRGRHTLQFGGQLRREYNNVRELQQTQGSHSFGGDWTALVDLQTERALPFTGNGLASLLLGLPTSLSNQFNRGFFYFRQTEIGLYVNDRWNVSRRLTLNLGLRWDKWTPYREKFDRLAVPDLDSVFDRFQVVTPKDRRMEDLPGIPPAVLASWRARGLTWTTAREAGMPDDLFRADNNNFGPRLGAAFRINDKTALRGGYGEYFWTMPLSQLLQTSRTNPPLNLRFVNDIGARNATFNYPLVSNPAAGDYIGQVTVDTEGIVLISPRAQGAMLWDGRHWKDGRAQSWHITLERELPYRMALRLSYIGEHGRDLEQRFVVNSQEAEFNYVARTGMAPPANRDLLRRNPNWGVAQAANRTGFSNSHSAQVEIERRFSEGVVFQWFYVYTRALTTTDVGGFTSGNTSINSADSGGQVPENIQILGAPDLRFEQRLRLVYFNSTNVPPHRIRYNGIVDLPFGRGKRLATDVHGPLRQILSGWQVAFIGDWRSGFWSSVNTGRFVFGDPRLNANQRVEMTIFGRRRRLWFRGDFDPSQASNVTGGSLEALVPADRSQRVVRPLGPSFDNRLPQTLANGTTRLTPIGDLYNWSPRASILGPGAWNVDLALFKTFKIREQVAARFSADFFNFFNHPNDISPDNITGLQDLSRQSNEPRTIQFSLRIDW